MLLWLHTSPTQPRAKLFFGGFFLFFFLHMQMANRDSSSTSLIGPDGLVAGTRQKGRYIRMSSYGRSFDLSVSPLFIRCHLAPDWKLFDQSKVLRCYFHRQTSYNFDSIACDSRIARTDSLQDYLPISDVRTSLKHIW